MDFDYDTARSVLTALFAPSPTPMNIHSGSLRPESACLSVGDYIKVDLNETREESSRHNFSRYSVETVGREVRDSQGSITSIMATTREFGTEIMEHRQRYFNATKYSHSVAQTEA